MQKRLKKSPKKSKYLIQLYSVNSNKIETVEIEGCKTVTHEVADEGFLEILDSKNRVVFGVPTSRVISYKIFSQDKETSSKEKKGGKVLSMFIKA